MNFLVDQYEIRGGRLCGEMPDMSASKTEAPKAYRTLTTIGNPRVEVGLSLHGICGKLTTHPEEKQVMPKIPGPRKIDYNWDSFCIYWNLN